MKHTVVYLVSILILWGCSDKPAPTAVEGPSEHEQAIKMFNKGKSFDDCMAMQQQAIDELRAGRAPEAGFEILSQMGYFKSRAGDYLGALEYMREASDSLDAMPAETADAESAIQFWGNLANLYCRFGLYDQALERNDKAIALARLSYPGRLPDLLLTDRIRLNSLIESLNDELSKRNAEDKQAELLNLILLEKDDEAQFRRTFAELHPGFVERLRKEFPSITSGNELLCMLISLKKSNDDIALALGISRESVVTARYRLRSRFNLPKDVDLNDFIISRL